MRLLPLILIVAAALIAAACGSDPTATPVPPTNTPPPAATATPTLASGVPTPTPRPAPTATPVPSFDAEAYFSGQTITINVGFSPGGGYDIFSRIFANTAPAHMPGNPRFIVRNLPGGGGERGLQVTDNDPADGYTIGILHPRFVKRELTGLDVDGFDLGTINFIGSASSNLNVNSLAVRRDMAMTWDDILALNRTLTNGETSPGASSGAGAAMIELVGGPIKIVYGYGGSAEIQAAFDRKEIDLTTNAGPDSVPRNFPEWITDKYFVPVLRWGADPSQDPEWGQWLETLGVPDPPHVLDVLDLTQDQKNVFLLSESVDDTFSRTFILHPDTPPEIVTAWQAAFEDMVADPQFLELAGIAGYEVGLTGPEAMAEAVATGLDLLQDEALKELFIQLAGPGD